jgi:2-polyprenyl-3-methyl-5-hydroxy-6-metoxy-1,4-benzoquinol methylase
MPASERERNEIAHGRKLARAGAEHIWGWETPAGRIRAERRARLIASSAGLRAGARVMEVGCGTGLFTEYFACSGAEIVALDISEELLAGARQRNLPDTVSFIRSPFEAWGEDGAFNAIIGSSILHHLDIGAALRRIHRLLKPGGKMSFAEPNRLNPQIMIQKSAPWIKSWLGDSPNETAFFRWKLAAMMKDAGFSDIRIVPLDWLHPLTPRSLIGWAQKAGSAFEQTPILREFAGSLFIRGRRI